MKTQALLIVDHGSKRDAANDMLFDMVTLLQSLKPTLIVVGAHMELADPNIPDTIKACVDAGASHIIAHPYMLSPGRHAMRDIPNMVHEAASDYDIQIEVTEPLGLDDGIINVIKKRCGLD